MVFYGHPDCGYLFFYNFIDIFDIPYWNLCTALCSVLLSEQCNNNDITLFKTDCLIRQ